MIVLSACDVVVRPGSSPVMTTKSLAWCRTLGVMPALVAGIHAFLFFRKKKGVDGRDKPGHDDVLCHSGTARKRRTRNLDAVSEYVSGFRVRRFRAVPE